MRFGLVRDGTGSPAEVARQAEDSGYSTLLFPDHTGMLAPLMVFDGRSPRFDEAVARLAV